MGPISIKVRANFNIEEVDFLNLFLVNDEVNDVENLKVITLKLTYLMIQKIKHLIPL